MNNRTQAILADLQTVESLRTICGTDARLASQVHALKTYQAARFERTYADWLAKPDAVRACRFFLDELYGAKDFTQRDAQFARVVPTMTRLFPDELSATIQSLGALHALSETMDHQMAKLLPSANVSAPAYAIAWQATGQPAARAQQIKLMHDVGTALSAYTRRPVLRQTLKIMRGPAAAAGLASLQAFLEDGFDSFASLPNAVDFLNAVSIRESTLCELLFALKPAQMQARFAQARADVSGTDPLGQFP